MNVLQIIPSMHPDSGGTSQGIRNMVPELQKMGIHNEVVCLDDPAASFIKNDPFTIVALGPAKGPWQYSNALVPWLVDNLGRFDVVIVNALWLYHGYGFLKAFKQYKRKLAANNNAVKPPRFYVMPHGMLDPYFQQAPDRKLKAMRNWLYWKLIENKLVNGADGILFTCKTELLLARDPFRPYHPKKEINIGYGAEAPPRYIPAMKEAFLEKCLQVANQPFLLFLSRIHEKKGIDQLLDAYIHLLNENAARPAMDRGRPLPKLVIAGPGLDTVYGKKMQQLATVSDLVKQSIFFPGMLSGNAKWGAFYLSEAFILPSHQENFGIAVVEALACGKPVMISNQVNIWPEIFEAGAGLVEDDTNAGTRNLLTTWMQLTGEEKSQMGLNAGGSFQNYFSIGIAAKRFHELVMQAGNV